jgi:hypothetical protein
MPLVRAALRNPYFVIVMSLAARGKSLLRAAAF